MADARRHTPQEEAEGYASMGVRLREAREFLGLSQEAVAEALRIPRASISAIESGRRKVGSLELREFARIYKRPLDWFYGSDEEPIAEDETVTALFRATSNLKPEDKEQVLRFAEFLRGAGQAPARRRAK
jgi:transcriptional regulator with XRE-family HTH domain